MWTAGEIDEVLGAELAEEAKAWWGVTEAGNFEGATILHRPVRGDLLRPPAIEEARRRLFEARELRPRPGLDDKVLTEWNGLFLATLAEAAAATGTASWLEAAVQTGEFLLANLRRDDGRWLRSWQADGGARHLALAADHAALVVAFTRARRGDRAGPLDHRGPRAWPTPCSTCSGTRCRARSSRPATTPRCWSPGRRTCSTTPRRRPTPKPPWACYRLGALTGEARYTNHADQILRLLGPLTTQSPLAFANLLAAVDLRRAGITEIAVVGDRPDLVEAVQQRFLPNAVLAWGEPYESPLWEQRRDGFAYVCRDYTCQAPVATVEALVAQLG